MNVEYMILNPSGNLTALVLGDAYSQEDRIRINDAIMALDPAIEQVGFLSAKECRLTMAGGEFCGNATRCAAYYYHHLTERDGSMIYVNSDVLATGADGDDVWTEIPVDGYEIEGMDGGRYLVKMKGITHLVLREERLADDSENYLKATAQQLMENYHLDDEAVGVMFQRREADGIHMYPVIWVRSVDTLICENACGSGTIATAMVEAVLAGATGSYQIFQPSGDLLGADIRMENGRVAKAVLSGQIKTDREILSIHV